MNKKNKVLFLVILILLASAILITPLFAKPKVARPWDEVSNDQNDFWKQLGVYNNVSKSEIKNFLSDYDNFVKEAKEAYNDKDVSTLRRLKKESIDYEDKFFVYKKSDNWTTKDTTTFVTQTKNLEKYLLNRFYEKPTSSSSSSGKTPPTKR